MNICQIKGRLTKDPEVKDTKTGKKLLTFTLVYHAFQNTGTEDENVHFISVEVWEKLAELFAPLLTKGIEILVNGNMLQNRWKDSKGNTRSYHKITAKTISIIDINFKSISI